MEKKIEAVLATSSPPACNAQLLSVAEAMCEACAKAIWHSSSADEAARLVRKIDAAAIIAALPAAAPQVAADERAALEDARNAAYPVPDSPHTSVNLRAVAERTGFTRGWRARAALAAAPVQADDPPELTDAGIEAVWKGLNGDTEWLRTFGYQQFARAILAAAPVQAKEPKPFAGPGAWFSVDVLGNPMREYAPGKWESFIWPSGMPDAAPVQAQEPVKHSGPKCFNCDATTVEDCNERGCGGLEDGNGEPEPAPVQPVAVPDGEEFGFKAARLRRTAFLLGLEGAIPDNDKDLMGCMGAVLGMICREVERIAAPAAQGDAKELTDAQIEEIYKVTFNGAPGAVRSASKPLPLVFAFARAIIAAIAAKAAS